MKVSAQSAISARKNQPAPGKGRDGEVVETGLQRASIVHIEGNRAVAAQDLLAVEEPLEIQLEHGPADARAVKSVAVTMRTPGQDEELVAGFLMTEGVIGDPEDIQAIASAGPNRIRVELVPEVAVKATSLERNFYVTSGCGVCGKASLLALQSVAPPRRDNRFRMRGETLRSLPGQLREQQVLFKKTGGLHAAGLFDAVGGLCLLREDVGRHNAVDKLIGSEWLACRTPLEERALVLSGRASFELLQKAVMAGIPMVACVGAPSSFAVAIAAQFDVTLVGFLREESFNVYQGAERID
jgi:FdhD protein